MTRTSSCSRAAKEARPTAFHLVWSATTTTRRADCRKVRLVSASARLGVVSPASGERPWQPRISRLTCSERMAWSVTGPTRASEGVRTPPVRITVAVAGVPSSPGCSSRSAIRSELVTTVRPSTACRCRATAKVVVPAARAIAEPGGTSAAAARAIASLAGSSQCALVSNPGSPLDGASTRTAPPCTLCTRPRRASASRSRRTVMSDTPRSRTSSVTRTPPRARTCSRMSTRRWPASGWALSAIGRPPSITSGEWSWWNTGG